MDSMDMYGLPPLPPPDFLPLDDLLDFNNDNIFPSISMIDHNNSSSLPSNNIIPYNSSSLSADFTTSDDAAGLEWVSHFVDNNTFSDLPPAATIPIRPDSSFTNQSPAKSFRPQDPPATGKPDSNDKPCNFPSPSVRRCSHCASEKTPQWRTGPLGPKTLCNACGVRYKSGRLVPEYRPASSPTFVLTQHSNSHRKVLELRRQKELLRLQQQQQQQQEGQPSDHVY